MNSPEMPEATVLVDPKSLSKHAAQAPSKLGLRLLVALVVGSIIGSGIFGLPQNMAAGAILIGWTVTGIGMLLLVRVYQTLSLRKPELDNGVYAYSSVHGWRTNPDLGD